MKKLLFTVMLVLGLVLVAPVEAQTMYNAGDTVSSLSLVTTTGAGTSYALPLVNGAALSKFTWTVTFKTAAPAAQTTNLEGSIDNVFWFTLDSSTNLSYTSDTNSGEMRHVTQKPVKFVRCNLSSYTQGGNAGVTCKLIATMQ